MGQARKNEPYSGYMRTLPELILCSVALAGAAVPLSSEKIISGSIKDELAFVYEAPRGKMVLKSWKDGETKWEVPQVAFPSDIKFLGNQAAFVNVRNGTLEFFFHSLESGVLERYFKYENAGYFMAKIIDSNFAFVIGVKSITLAKLGTRLTPLATYEYSSNIVPFSGAETVGESARILVAMGKRGLKLLEVEGYRVRPKPKLLPESDEQLFEGNAFLDDSFLLGPDKVFWLNVGKDESILSSWEFLKKGLSIKEVHRIKGPGKLFGLNGEDVAIVMDTTKNIEFVYGAAKASGAD